MKICVCGWYLEEFDNFYMSLHRIKDKYPVTVISHKDSEFLKSMDLPYVLTENVGLEWGAYHYYLTEVWDGTDSVLFCHDDIEINPTIVDEKIVPPEYIFDRIAECKVDQAYIFGSRHEDVENYGRHGRMVFMGKDFLQKAKEMGGFWYDHKNKGFTTEDDEELKEKFGCSGYNAGIIKFHEQAKYIGGDIYRKIYIPSFALAKRGLKGSEHHHYGKWEDKLSAILERPGKKLNLGCGSNIWETHTNVDLYNDLADIKADVRDLPFEDNSYDLIENNHLIEHLYKSDAEKALREWLRVLKPGGHVFISCPDIIPAFEALKDGFWDQALHCLYGSEEPGMKHHYGYSRDSLKRALEEAGFVDVEVRTAIGFRPTPSLIAIGKKP